MSIRDCRPLAQAFLPRGVGRLAAAVVAAALCACAGGRYPPAPAAADVASAPDAYKIGPLDALNIVVWRNADLSTTVTVRPDGKISTPLGGEIQAAGLSPAELSSQLEQTLSKYVRDAKVSVMVSGFQGVYDQQIRIVGDQFHQSRIRLRGFPKAAERAVGTRKHVPSLDVIRPAFQALRKFCDHAFYLLRGDFRSRIQRCGPRCRIKCSQTAQKNIERHGNDRNSQTKRQCRPSID